MCLPAALGGFPWLLDHCGVSAKDLRAYDPRLQSESGDDAAPPTVACPYEACFREGLTAVAQQASAAPDATRSSEPGMGSPWLQMHDSNTNKHYYYNQRTGQTSWTKPGTEVPVAPAHPKSPLAEPSDGHGST